MLSTLGAQRIAANQATRPALLPSLGNPHVTEDSDSPRTGNFPPAAPEIPSLCPAGLQGPACTDRSSREEKQMLFWGIQPLKRDASSPPSPSPAGRRRPPTTHVPKSRAASLREGIQQQQRAGEIVPKSQEPERGWPIASTEAARAWKTEQEGGNRHTAALKPPPAHGAPPQNHVSLFQTRLAFTLTRAGLPRLI